MQRSGLFNTFYNEKINKIHASYIFFGYMRIALSIKNHLQDSKISRDYPFKLFCPF